jgi:hypothetical protein
LHETGFRFPGPDVALMAARVVVSGLPAGIVPALDAPRVDVKEGQTRG